MENEIIIKVLTEIMEDEKENTKLLLGINSLMNSQETRLGNLERKLEEMIVKSDSKREPDMGTELLENIKELKSMVISAQINNKQEKRILLFPEHNAPEYYSVILRWVLYMIIATYGYWIIRYSISSFIRSGVKIRVIN